MSNFAENVTQTSYAPSSVQLDRATLFSEINTLRHQQAVLSKQQVGRLAELVDGQEEAVSWFAKGVLLARGGQRDETAAQSQLRLWAQDASDNIRQAQAMLVLDGGHDRTNIGQDSFVCFDGNSPLADGIHEFYLGWAKDRATEYRSGTPLHDSVARVLAASEEERDAVVELGLGTGRYAQGKIDTGIRAAALITGLRISSEAQWKVRDALLALAKNTNEPPLLRALATRFLVEGFEGVTDRREKSTVQFYRQKLIDAGILLDWHYGDPLRFDGGVLDGIELGGIKEYLKTGAIRLDEQRLATVNKNTTGTQAEPDMLAIEVALYGFFGVDDGDNVAAAASALTGYHGRTDVSEGLQAAVALSLFEWQCDNHLRLIVHAAKVDSDEQAKFGSAKYPDGTVAIAYDHVFAADNVTATQLTAYRSLSEASDLDIPSLPEQNFAVIAEDRQAAVDFFCLPRTAEESATLASSVCANSELTPRAWYVREFLAGADQTGVEAGRDSVFRYFNTSQWPPYIHDPIALDALLLMANKGLPATREICLQRIETHIKADTTLIDGPAELIELTSRVMVEESAASLPAIKLAKHFGAKDARITLALLAVKNNDQAVGTALRERAQFDGQAFLGLVQGYIGGRPGFVPLIDVYPLGSTIPYNRDYLHGLELLARNPDFGPLAIAKLGKHGATEQLVNVWKSGVVSDVLGRAMVETTARNGRDPIPGYIEFWTAVASGEVAVSRDVMLAGIKNVPDAAVHQAAFKTLEAVEDREMIVDLVASYGKDPLAQALLARIVSGDSDEIRTGWTYRSKAAKALMAVNKSDAVASLKRGVELRNPAFHINCRNEYVRLLVEEGSKESLDFVLEQGLSEPGNGFLPTAIGFLEQHDQLERLSAISPTTRAPLALWARDAEEAVYSAIIRGFDRRLANPAEINAALEVLSSNIEYENCCSEIFRYLAAPNVVRRMGNSDNESAINWPKDLNLEHIFNEIDFVTDDLVRKSLIIVLVEACKAMGEDEDVTEYATRFRSEANQPTLSLDVRSYLRAMAEVLERY